MLNLHLFAGIISVAGLFYAAYRLKNLLNPIIVGYAGFTFCVVVSYLHPLAPDPIGVRRTSMLGIGPQTEALLLSAASISLLLFLVILSRKEYQDPWDTIKIIELRGENTVFTLIVLLAVGELVASVVVYGGVALFSMQQGASHYGDFRFGMVTEFARGGPKFILLILLIKLYYSTVSVTEFVRRNLYPIGCCVIGIGANMAGGLRNLVLLPILLAGFVVIERFRGVRVFKASFIVIVLGILCTFLFVIVGNIRVGTSHKFSGELLNWKSNVQILDQTMSWVFLYSYPNILNLDQIVYGFENYQNGRIILSQIFPDRLLEIVGLAPYGSSIDFLNFNLLFPYPGLTFRTIYADLIADFGLVGSIIAGALILAFVLLTYVYRNRNIFILFLFLNSFKGMMLFGMKNSFLGLYDIFPIMLWCLIVRKPFKGITLRRMRPWGS